jgi:hypothetical protein
VLRCASAKERLSAFLPAGGGAVQHDTYPAAGPLRGRRCKGLVKDTLIAIGVAWSQSAHTNCLDSWDPYSQVVLETKAPVRAGRPGLSQNSHAMTTAHPGAAWPQMQSPDGRPSCAGAPVAVCGRLRCGLGWVSVATIVPESRCHQAAGVMRQIVPAACHLRRAPHGPTQARTQPTYGSG